MLQLQLDLMVVICSSVKLGLYTCSILETSKKNFNLLYLLLQINTPSDIPILFYVQLVPEF